MKENFSKMMNEINIQPQDSETVSNKINLKRLTPRNIIKMSKVKNKEIILKKLEQ